MKGNGGVASFDAMYVEISQPRAGLDRALLSFYLTSQQKHLFIYDVPLNIVSFLQTSFMHKEGASVAWVNERQHGRNLAGDLIGIYFFARSEP